MKQTDRNPLMNRLSLCFNLRNAFKRLNEFLSQQKNLWVSCSKIRFKFANALFKIQPPQVP